jgi:hypothetical protein
MGSPNPYSLRPPVASDTSKESKRGQSQCLATIAALEVVVQKSSCPASPQLQSRLIHWVAAAIAFWDGHWVRRNCIITPSKALEKRPGGPGGLWNSQGATLSTHLFFFFVFLVFWPSLSYSRRPYEVFEGLVLFECPLVLLALLLLSPPLGVPGSFWSM